MSRITKKVIVHIKSISLRYHFSRQSKELANKSTYMSQIKYPSMFPKKINLDKIYFLNGILCLLSIFL